MEAYPTDHTSWLAKLVSFDTVSRNSNLPLLDYVKGYLESLGIDSLYVYHPAKTHANLFATLPGKDGTKEGGIVLSGHTDVVPVDGQKWDSDPFTLTERDGKLYGRGTADMKGFIAVCLTLLPTFLAMKRTKPIHLVFSFDEECGCRGIPYLIRYLKAMNFKADCCLVGDTGFEIRTGSKGLNSWKVVVRGKAIHSSMALMNTSCNAIEYAAQIITKIRAMAMDLKKNSKHDPRYSCPFSCMSLGTIKGGNAVNTVPAECEFEFSVRVTETAMAKRVEAEVRHYIDSVVLPAMREEYPEASVEMTPDWDAPAFNADENNPFTQTVRKMMNDFTVRKMSGGSESGFFEETLGIPTVIVGPGGYKVHQANEHTEVRLLDKSMKFTEDLVRRYTGAEAVSKL
ncbi:glutamamyl carboxypeptidase [Novymonas esmeraldas]|uniref:Glutamamyl carboxypeptidase n=1 Tax=Novymonas esmeraldas TaxID=1808958 RepID=A0AAW0F8D5_9TRYP